MKFEDILMILSLLLCSGLSTTILHYLPNMDKKRRVFWAFNSIFIIVRQLITLLKYFNVVDIQIGSWINTFWTVFISVYLLKYVSDTYKHKAYKEDSKGSI